MSFSFNLSVLFITIEFEERIRKEWNMTIIFLGLFVSIGKGFMCEKLRLLVLMLVEDVE